LTGRGATGTLGAVIKDAPPRPHWLIDFYGCDPERLDDVAGLKRLLYEVAATLGATTIGDVFHRFSPCGVTGVVAVAESHLSIHTWVESGYAAVDLFLCTSGATPERVERAVGRVAEFLGARRRTVSVAERGAEVRGGSRPEVPVGAGRADAP